MRCEIEQLPKSVAHDDTVVFSLVLDEDGRGVVLQWRRPGETEWTRAVALSATGVYRYWHCHGDGPFPLGADGRIKDWTPTPKTLDVDAPNPADPNAAIRDRLGELADAGETR